MSAPGSRRDARVSARRRRLYRVPVWVRAAVAGVATSLVVGSGVGLAGVALTAQPAAAADASVTSSAVTVASTDPAAKGGPIVADGTPAPDLKVTVSQTEDLVSQGIKISWTGGKQSAAPVGGNGGSDFLQIAQCWGDDPDHPGHPDRRTCQYGATLGPGSMRDGTTETENVATKDAAYTAFTTSPMGIPPTYTAIPFVGYNPAKAVDPATAAAEYVVTNLTKDSAGVVKQRSDADYVNVNENQFFTRYTTNEIPWAPSGDDGTGSVPFEVQTAVQSTGLGCGTPITQTDGTVVGQSCWLVIIPRGAGDSGQANITKSGLWWDAWEHHLAVKLDFKPVGVRCEIGASEKQLAGSELVARAISSWQPNLCLGQNGAPFVLRTGNEADALVDASATTASPLALTTRPLDMDLVSWKEDPLQYAPVALGGVALTFAIDRQPNTQTSPDAYKAKARLPFTTMNLTPRLVAKLLTSSYTDSLPTGADRSHIGYVNFAKPGPNPRTLLQDQDFLAINDEEWKYQTILGPSVADALMPKGRSDLAVRLWEYVLADQEARDWLSGKPDPWGMVVNPWYSNNPALTGVLDGVPLPANWVPLSLPSESFPKADPIEKPDTTLTDLVSGTGAINLVTWRPFTNSLANGAYRVLRGDGMTLGAWDSQSNPPKYGSSAPDSFGSRKVIALTTTPAASLYQAVTASLRNPAGQFVAPTSEAMLAAAAAMVPTAEQPAVLEFDPASAKAAAAATAYPLTVPVYAALNPSQQDAGLRAIYADMIRYAVTGGQNPGTDDGELPPGYAPLPESWVAQAKAAADVIQNGPAPAPSPSKPPAQSAYVPPTSSSSSYIPPAVPVADTATGDGAPTATGTAAGTLSGGTTAADPALPFTAGAIPIGVLAGILAAILVPIVPHLRSRR